MYLKLNFYKRKRNVLFKMYVIYLIQYFALLQYNYVFIKYIIMLVQFNCFRKINDKNEIKDQR